MNTKILTSDQHSTPAFVTRVSLKLSPWNQCHMSHRDLQQSQGISSGLAEKYSCIIYPYYLLTHL